MDEILEKYKGLKQSERVFAELLIYSYIAFDTGNKSEIKISKGEMKKLNGDTVIKYEIEVPIYD